MTTSTHEFHQLLVLEARALYERAFKLSGSAFAAEDLVQDTIERALRNAHRFVPGSSLRAWLLTILSNLHIDGCRRRGRERLTLTGAPPDVAAVEGEGRPRWEHLSLSDVEAVIPLLTPTSRETMRSFLDGTRSHRELSTKLDIPICTVGTRLMRARRQLRNLLEMKRDGQPTRTSVVSGAAGGGNQFARRIGQPSDDVSDATRPRTQRPAQDAGLQSGAALADSGAATRGWPAALAGTSRRPILERQTRRAP